jgi:hypothetical protein
LPEPWRFTIDASVFVSALRAADAVYAATAGRFEATLVALDTEQRTRLPHDITALHISEALEA